MQSNILDFISQQYNTMTRSSKKLADYIFTNKSMVQYMSITSLAEASGVSEATITRFCRGLGLAGYNEFKLALARVDHTTVTGDPTDTGAAVTDGDSFENVCRKLYQTDVKAMSETLELMDTDSTAKAVDLLSGARRVFCFGQGGQQRDGHGGLGPLLHRLLPVPPHRGLPHAGHGRGPLRRAGRDPLLLLLGQHPGHAGRAAAREERGGLRSF